MHYLRSILEIAVPVLLLYLGLCVYLVYVEADPPTLVIYATNREFGKGIQLLIPPLARLRLHSLKTCPPMGGSPAMAYITVTHSQLESDKAEVLDLAETFLRAGCDINDYGRSRSTPLHLAILFDDSAMVDFLLKHGADPHLRTLPPRKPGENPLPTDGMDAYELAVWLRDHAKQKRDMTVVIAALQRK